MNIIDCNFREFCEKLGSALTKPLPGISSQLKMASHLRVEAIKKTFDMTRAAKSAVLIVFYPFKGSVFFPLILRPAYDGIHSSQISFPGGRMELSDASLVQTALREAHEELAIQSDQVKVIGKLTDVYIPPSNYLVSPIVGYSQTVPQFIPDPYEVEQVVEADLRLLFDHSLLKEKTIYVGDVSIRAPYFDFYGQTVWGATAMMLSELKDIIENME